ncbi:MAG: hypothetical protein CM15mP102_11770 [Flavobacteriales bacterium]|nr:MAG: hypothetical protein CM15mP102_11770 [Flavobacteriales bacterium]
MVLRVKLKPKKFYEKYSIIFLLLVVSFSCSQEKYQINMLRQLPQDLQNLLVTYSSDKFEGDRPVSMVKCLL